jgi:hypothetical protein
MSRQIGAVRRAIRQTRILQLKGHALTEQLTKACAEDRFRDSFLLENGVTKLPCGSRLSRAYSRKPVQSCLKMVQLDVAITDQNWLPSPVSQHTRISAQYQNCALPSGVLYILMM